MEPISNSLSKYRDYVFETGITTADYIDSLQKFEVRDSDTFLVTYPKSGTVWTQQILTSIFESDGQIDGSNNMEKIPWIEYCAVMYCPDHALRLSPRLFTSHLIPALLPPGLKEKKGKIVYIMRNPKDVVVSFYHFCHVWESHETPRSFDEFLQKFLAGEVSGASWFHHVREWYTQKDQYNILFLTYEEMKLDLKSAVQRICHFLEKDLDKEAIDKIVKKATFKNMKKDPQANYDFLGDDLVNKQNGGFLRKGTIGDWKNTFTVAQSEMFDRVYRERMGDLQLKFIWDMNGQPQ